MLVYQFNDRSEYLFKEVFKIFVDINTNPASFYVKNYYYP